MLQFGCLDRRKEQKKEITNRTFTDCRPNKENGEGRSFARIVNAVKTQKSIRARNNTKKSGEMWEKWDNIMGRNILGGKTK